MLRPPARRALVVWFDCVDCGLCYELRRERPEEAMRMASKCMRLYEGAVEEALREERGASGRPKAPRATS